MAQDTERRISEPLLEHSPPVGSYNPETLNPLGTARRLDLTKVVLDSEKQNEIGVGLGKGGESKRSLVRNGSLVSVITARKV